MLADVIAKTDKAGHIRNLCCEATSSDRRERGRLGLIGRGERRALVGLWCLGLGLAHGLVQAMGGELEVARSGPGGTSMRLTLPRAGET